MLFHSALSGTEAPGTSLPNAHGTPIRASGSAAFMAVRNGLALTAYEVASVWVPTALPCVVCGQVGFS